MHSNRWIVGYVALATFLTACTQLQSIDKPSSNSSTPPNNAAGTPPQDPILRPEAEMHTARINSISVDDTAQYLVTASDDKTLRVWQRETGQLLRILRPPIGIEDPHEGKMFTAAISPDGTTIAGAGYSGYEWDRVYSIYIFDRASGHMLPPIKNLPAAVGHLSFSSDGLVLVATLLKNSGVRFYGAKGGELLAADEPYGAETYSASFDKDGRTMTVSRDGFLRVYSRDFRRLHEMPLPRKMRPHTVSLSRDGSKVAVGYDDNSSQVDVFSGKDLKYLYSPKMTETNNGSLAVVSWSKDGETLYAGGGYRHGHTHLIRKWTQQGEGSGTDLPASSNAILSIVPLQTGGIAYSAADPAFGVFDNQNARHLSKDPVTLDYRDTHDGLLLSPDGTTVQFSYKSNGRLVSSRFSIKDRALVQNPAPLSTLRPPLTMAAGLAVEHWKDSKDPMVNGHPLRDLLKSNELSRCVALNADRQTVLIGTTWQLLYVTAQGQKIWAVPTPADVWAVNIVEVKNGTIAAAALADGTIRWYELSEGRELLALFPQPKAKRWVAWTRSGYYDAGPGSEGLVGWHRNIGSATAAQFSSLSRTRDSFYHPKVVETILETLDEDVAFRQGTESRPYTDPGPVDDPDEPTPTHPIVIRSPTNGTTVSSSTVSIQYQVYPKFVTPDMAIRVLIDDKEVVSRGIAQIWEKPIDYVNVQIPHKDCVVSLVLTNQSGRTIPPASIKLKWVMPALYVLAIGTNPDPSLAHLAAKDADDMARAFSLQKGRLYRDVLSSVVTDKAATREAIAGGFEWLTQHLTSNDVAVIFISGQTALNQHGQRFMMTPGAKTDELDLSALALYEIQDLIRELPSRSLLLLDLCHASSPLDAHTCAKALTQLSADASAASRRVVVISSATVQQQTSDTKKLVNGIFTTELLDGLYGNAAQSAATSPITAGMLERYLKQRAEGQTDLPQIVYTDRSLDTPDFDVAMRQDSSQGNNATLQPPPKHNPSPKMWPPQVSIVSPKDGDLVSTNQLTLQCAVETPSGEPITEFLASVDGRRVQIHIQHPPLNSPTTHRTLVPMHLEIPPGTNLKPIISIIAKNRWGSSEPKPVQIQRSPSTQPDAKPTLYALVVGVKDDKLLKWPAKDALDFARALQQQGGGIYRSVTTTVLCNEKKTCKEDATRINILKGLTWLTKVTSQNDMAVIFLAGHGIKNRGGSGYFLPADGQMQHLRQTGLPFSAIKTAIATLKGIPLVFADTCHAGHILGQGLSAIDMNRMGNEFAREETGAVLFAASTGNERAVEDPRLENGVFTKAIVEGFNGKARVPGHPFITVQDMREYISERVRALNVGQQNPTVTMPPAMQDFRIAMPPTAQ